MAASAAALPPRLARARRTAVYARAAAALTGLVTVLVSPELHARPAAGALGFGILAFSALVMRTSSASAVEEAIGAAASMLIVGFDAPHVTALTLLWLCAAVGGILGRGGRVGTAGRAIVIVALVTPIATAGELSVAYCAFMVGAASLLLSAGRTTRELSGLLAEARHMADHDSLTGTLSRAAFREALEARVAAGAATVIAIDLDGFGTVNKVHGHATGDRTLVAVVARMSSVLSPDQVLGRLGGDEFAVAIGAGDGTLLAGRLRDALAEPLDGVGVIGASFGVATAPAHGDDGDALLRAADMAQRVAKRAGSGRVEVYDGGSLTDLGPTGALGALARLIGGEGLTMVAQPIVDIGSGRVHAYEALARFRTRGNSSPLHWFALAEEYNLRADLELACLRAALVLLPQRPAGTRLSVNLSGRLLGDRRVNAQLDRCEDVSGLIIEVTEDSLIGDDAAAALATAPLLERGITIAVDDMGAGYSGLRQVAALRPGYLKIDRGLITGIDTSPERAALVEAVVGYARRTGSDVVAEGVETEAELATVRALGVTLVQGFLLGRPAPPFEELDKETADAPDRSSVIAS